MTDLPYTTDDLRAEAARQHHAASTDHLYDEVANYMGHRPIASRPGVHWVGLTTDDRATAHEAVNRLLEDAEDTSRWAVDLGADGLQPDGHHTDFGQHPDKPGPLLRLHFAFQPEVDADTRHAYAALVTEAVNGALDRALEPDAEDNAAPVITADEAAHVLWMQPNPEDGTMPARFYRELLATWNHADDENHARLSSAYPGYGAALDLLRQPDGVQQLQAIAAGTEADQ